MNFPLKKYLYLLLFVLTLNTFSIAKSSDTCTTTMTSQFGPFAGDTSCTLVWYTTQTDGQYSLVNNYPSGSYIHEIVNYSSQTVDHEAIVNYGLIDSILNTGTLTGNFGIVNDTGATRITSITNTGTLRGTTADIWNKVSIGELNNLQGFSSSDPLTYKGNLPTNYNIIINSVSDFGKIAFTAPSGTTTFGIYTGSTVAAGTYASVLTGLTSINLVIRSGSYSGFNWTLLNSSGTTWDLAFSLAGPLAADTQASLTTQARRLRSTFNSTMASGNFANMNTYDCNLFDKNNMCISAGGRYTNIDNPSSNNSAAVVVLGYKVSPNIRIGGFLDQSFNNNMPTGINVSNKNPMMGGFVVWNKNSDGLGYQVKLANAYQDKDVTSTRDAFGETGEAGKGKTNLNTQSYVGELSYAFNYQDSTIVRPYFALRYTNIKQDAYTETGVSTPLSYAKLGDRSTTALMGVKLNHALTPRTNLTASLGLEQDINHKTDQLTASGVADLTSENFNNNIKRTRPVASAGAYYAVAKNQRLSGEVYYQQLPFQSTGSATAYFNYMIGF